RGRCPRQNCNFAHGEAELRRFGGSFHEFFVQAIAFQGLLSGGGKKKGKGRSERRHRKKQHTDGESDVSDSFKGSDGPEDRKKEDKTSSYDEKDGLEEQKVDEAHKLSSRIADLESQLSKEQEDCRRTTSKIKKFIKAHGRYMKAQEELKRQV
ncbi:hypothetical protein B296_00014162, partial [Ensete ventricosum]